MTEASPIDIKSKKWRFYEPRVAYADTSNPLSLAIAGTTIKELEHLTRGIWTRSNMKSYNHAHDIAAEPISIDPEEDTPNSDDTEIISAIIKTCRITRSSVSEQGGEKNLMDRTDIVSTSIACEQEKEEGCLTDSEESPTTGNIDISSESDSDFNQSRIADSNEMSRDSSPTIDGIAVDEGDTSEPDHQFLNGLSMECPSLAAWERRLELFSKFDKGCVLDRSGWYEVTPEGIAMKIAEKIRRAITHCEGDSDIGTECVENENIGRHPIKKLKISDTNNDVHASMSLTDAELLSNSSRSRPVLAAACGCGGEAIALARCLTNIPIIAVDIDINKLQRCCEQNAKVYAVADKIDFIQCDINEFAKTRSSDIRTITEESVVELPNITGTKAIKQTVSRQKIIRPFSWCIMSPPWGGPKYRDKYCYSLGVQTFTDLVKMIQSCMKIADNLCLILPRNQDIDEIIHLACYGVPDGDRFIHVEFDRMTVRSDGYPKMLAVYLCRDPCLLLSEAELSKKAVFRASKLIHEFANVKSSSKPKVNDVRPALPELMVSYKMLQRKRTAELKLGLAAIYNVVFCRFLLGYLEEPAYQIRVLESYLQLIGVANLLRIVEETIRLTRGGGLKKRTNIEQSRSRGGLFFELLHQIFPEEFKVLRKWRKKFIESLKQHSGSNTTPS